MRQETGSNSTASANKVSIQLALDGHSFSATDVNADLPGSGEIDVLTPRTLLVPAEVFEEQHAPALLAAAGIPLAAGESVVWSNPQAETIAIMAAGTEGLKEVRRKFGEQTRFTSPLLRTPQITAPTVWMCRMPGVLYIKVYRNGLQFAEAVAAATEADVLYFMERLDAQFPSKEYVLRITGSNIKPLRGLLGRRFKESICE